MPNSVSASSRPFDSEPLFGKLHDSDTAMLSPAVLGLIAEFFKVLSESSRLQILCALKLESKNVTEIVDLTGLGQANVSKHLKILAHAGIVSRRSQGVSAYYEITNPFIFQLCELVCNSLAVQLEQQSQPLEKFMANKP